MAKLLYYVARVALENYLKSKYIFSYIVYIILLVVWSWSSAN